MCLSVCLCHFVLLSPSLPVSLSLSFFWPRNVGPPTGSRQEHSAVSQTKLPNRALIQLQLRLSKSVPSCVIRRQPPRQSNATTKDTRGTFHVNAFLCHSTPTTTPVERHHQRHQRDFPRQWSLVSLDANRHHSTPFDVTRRHHHSSPSKPSKRFVVMRSHPSVPPIDAARRHHQSSPVGATSERQS